jgi:hypothetical protein
MELQCKHGKAIVYTDAIEQEAIGDTVTILDQWKEVYNFKAGE